MSNEDSTPPLGAIGHEPTPISQQNPNNTYSSSGHLMGYGSPTANNTGSHSSHSMGEFVTSGVSDGSPWFFQVLREIFRKRNLFVWVIAIGLCWLSGTFRSLTVISNLAVIAALLISSSVLRRMAARLFGFLVLAYIAFRLLVVMHF